MSDFEDFFYWTPPGKRKRKNNLKENTICVQHKNNIAINTEKRIHKKKKKKKNFKFKGQERKKNKKERKKKKSSLELNDIQGFSVASDTVAKPKASDPQITHLTKDSKKKSKSKKKVTFDISPNYICVKRPKVVSWSLKENILPEIEAVTNISCSQVIKTQPSQAQSHDNDSQYTSDDVNSQDLFITQKTFRTFHSEPSSGEASDKEVTPTQQTITKKGVVWHSSVVKIQHDEGSHFHQHTKKVKEPLHIEKGALIVLSEEEEDFEQKPMKQIKLNSNFTEDRKAYGTVPAKPGVMNPYLDDPVVVKCSMDVTSFGTSSQESPLCLTNRASLALQTSTASISTQTENFFTAELSSYLSFCHKRRASLHWETLKPLDLSFPKRAREDQNRHLTVKTKVKVSKKKFSKHKASSLPEDTKGSVRKDSSLHSSTFSERLKPAVQQLWCEGSQCKGQNAPSPQSESEPKSADTTTSEDNEPACRTGKLDLTQVRAVQMRLNESFFFKTKGDRQSPRPESPLMKLVQSRKTKTRKCH